MKVGVRGDVEWGVVGLIKVLKRIENGINKPSPVQ